MSTNAVLGIIGFIVIAIATSILIAFGIRYDRSKQQGEKAKSLLDALTEKNGHTSERLRRLAVGAVVVAVLIIVFARLVPN